MADNADGKIAGVKSGLLWTGLEKVFVQGVANKAAFGQTVSGTIQNGLYGQVDSCRVGIVAGCEVVLRQSARKETVSEKVHVVLASDANYLPGLEVTRASMLRNCKSPERIAWHVYGEDDLAGLDVESFDAWNCGSKMVYLRLFLPDLLPDVDWVVYSDVDTVWNRDVCELWDEWAQENADGGPSICWVRDFRSVSTHERYGCTGVCVMNLKKLRAFGLARKSIEYVKAHGTPPFVDQGILNILLKDDCAILPCKWDAMGDCSNLPPEGERCVWHIIGVGRHFHDATPPVYPPQYRLWWMERTGDWDQKIDARSRVLAATWRVRRVAWLLPLAVRERIVRQWFFAKELCAVAKERKNGRNLR